MTKQRIRAASFDADGCIFNEAYINGFRNRQVDDVVEYNESLLLHNRAENQSMDRAYVFVGSNRQSYRVDRLNATKFGLLMTESCFVATQKLADALDATMDRFLLADVYGDLDDGRSFDLAISEEGTHADWVLDSSKATIVYAQVHKLANDKPEAEITYDFYDDKDEIATGIIHSLLPEVLPHNVTVRIFKYTGNVITLQGAITGTGIIDSTYRETVKYIASQYSRPGRDSKEMNLAKQPPLTAAFLPSRKPLVNQQNGEKRVSQPELRIFQLTSLTVGQKSVKVPNILSYDNKNSEQKSTNSDANIPFGGHQSSSSHRDPRQTIGQERPVALRLALFNSCDPRFIINCVLGGATIALLLAVLIMPSFGTTALVSGSVLAFSLFLNNTSEIMVSCFQETTPRV